MSEGVVDRPKLYFYRPVTSGLLDWLAEDGQPSHVTIMTLGFATLVRVHVYIPQTATQGATYSQCAGLA